MSYQDFLERKRQIGNFGGFDPVWMPDFLYDFQQHLDEWAIRKGRAMIAADCGLGKTPMQLVFAENVVRKENKSVLLLTPLAVSQQTVREAEKFGIECHRSIDGSNVPAAKIVMTNYERLNKFRPDDFAGVVLDESSCIKAMDGKTRDEVTEFLRTIKYRLLCTATAAPNDYVELGTASEAIGELGQRDMITKFFKQEQSNYAQGWGRQKYRLRGHAEVHFWRWVCSWARACRKPSDLGFSDKGFKLPPLKERDYIVEASTKAEGFLFDVPARNMREERSERRRTIEDRCEHAACLASDHKGASVLWCHLNDEGDLLAKILPGGVQVSGNDSIERKEEIYEAFASGEVKKLIIKPKIGAWGLNWQHCHHCVMFASHSWEQYYQAIRRLWRFGQKKTVVVDRVLTEGETRIAGNLASKADAADKMFQMLVEHMNDALKINRDQEFSKTTELPVWLS